MRIHFKKLILLCLVIAKILLLIWFPVSTLEDTRIPSHSAPQWYIGRSFLQTVLVPRKKNR
jgi:hypothetical protein